MTPGHANLQVPVCKRADYELIDVSNEGYCTLITDGVRCLLRAGWLFGGHTTRACAHTRTQGDTKEDVKLPSGELGETIQAALDAGEGIVFVNVTSAMNMEEITGYRMANE